MPKAPGSPKTGGRKKGVPNKLTGDVKAMVLGALEQKGGIEYLKKQADENPTAFMTLVGKILPLTVAGDKENPLHLLLSQIDGKTRGIPTDR